MVKLVEKNVAELIMVVMLVVVLLSSCSSSSYTSCAAYASVEVENELK
jgi:hypothetical protein